jgi:hypothetical protein
VSTKPASQRGWGNPGRPGSAQGRRYEAENIVSVKVPLFLGGGHITVLVHRDIAAMVFAGVRASSRVFDFNGLRDDWGWAHRYIRGREDEQILSNHSWGLAIDLDATQNPQQRRVPGRPIRRTIPDEVVVIMAKHGFAWGGNYAKTPDPMHFECLLTRDQARLLSAELVAKRLALQSLAPS